MKPFVKWAGGKRQILGKIHGYINDSLDGDRSYTYIEPFLGGGAVFFSLENKKAIVNDLNEDLINAYRVIASDSYEELISKLKEHAELYRADADEHYYEVRSWDREEGWPANHTSVERAARMIFLNRTCYNGLYRVNKKGQFNTPMGRYRNPTICDEANIREIHSYLSDPERSIEIMNDSYEAAIAKAKDGDVIYIDPPYDYEDDDGFTKYQMSGFAFEDFVKLKKRCDEALNRGAFVIISNNATQKVMDLFLQDPRYKVIYCSESFTTLRNINSDGAGRKTGKEVIFWGMDANVPFPQANDLEKVVRLVMAGEEALNDRALAQTIIGVTTERQVVYYLSALKFLNYLTHKNELTEKAKELRKDEILLRENIFEQLLHNELFLKPFEQSKESDKPDIGMIKSLLNESNKDLSESTLNRRASTIKAWVTWMLQHEESMRE